MRFRLTLPLLQEKWLDLYSFSRFVWRRLQAIQWQQSAAALTYTSLFALVPIMTVSYVMLSFMPQLEVVQKQIEQFIFTHFLPDTGNQVKAYLNQFSEQAKSLTVPGIIMLIITALMMLKTIENNFNTIWDVKQGRRGVDSFLLYWAVLSLGPVLAGAGLMFSTYLFSLTFLSDVKELMIAQPLVLQLAHFVPLLLTTASLWLIYSTVPNCPVPLKHAFIGALVAAICFAIIKKLFALGVEQSSYTLVYGAFAAVPMFLMWLYICWAIVLFGAVLVRSLGIYQPAKMRKKLAKKLRKR
jgi:membrane protein